MMSVLSWAEDETLHTGLAMTRILALGAASAAALARSRTMEALVLKRSGSLSQPLVLGPTATVVGPSRVMPGFRGTPAGMSTISASFRAGPRPLEGS